MSREYALQVAEGSGNSNDAMLFNATKSLQEVELKLIAS
jgi:hypothetical protein